MTFKTFSEIILGWMIALCLYPYVQGWQKKLFGYIKTIFKQQVDKYREYSIRVKREQQVKALLSAKPDETNK